MRVVGSTVWTRPMPPRQWELPQRTAGESAQEATRPEAWSS